jgi:hypothetical protein
MGKRRLANRSFAFSKKISAISKWKIIDNLRRSLLAPSLLLGLLAI